MVETYLADLEARIDPAVEDELLGSWQQFCDGQASPGIFAPRRRQSSPPGVEWPRVWVNDALDQPERMVLQQLGGCSAALASGSGAVLNVRSNFGTGILASLFGVTAFPMERELDTLPTNYPVVGGKEGIQRLLDRGVPDTRRQLMAKVLAMGAYYLELFQRYPKIQRYVQIYHPDFQGPIDNVELLWGSGLFLDLVDDPDQVSALLGLVTDTYIQSMRAWFELVPPRGETSAHWGLLHRGHVMLREDSLMNLSPSIYRDLILPHDQRIFDEFGGGAIHFCGRGTHFISHLSGLRGLAAINLSQPELNDMEKIYRFTVDRGINLLDLKHSAAESALARGRDLHGRVHCGFS